MRNILWGFQPFAFLSADTDGGANPDVTEVTEGANPPENAPEPKKPEYDEAAELEHLDKTVQANTKAEFATQLQRFNAAITTSMDAARILAKMAYTHFEIYGDLIYAQKFWDAMTGKASNFARREAFKAWLMTFSPAKMEGGKWSKDKSPEAVKFNQEEAFKVDFWDFAPERPIDVFTVETLEKFLKRQIAKYRNEKHAPKDQTALDALNTVDGAIVAAFAAIKNKPASQLSA